MAFCKSTLKSKKWLLVMAAVVLFLSTPIRASANERTYPSPHFDKQKVRAENVLEAPWWDFELNKLSCTVFNNFHPYVWEEMGKVHYNDLYHEIDNKEQASEAKALYEHYQEVLEYKRTRKGAWKTRKGQNLCKEAVAHWLSYDNKWYAEERAKAWEEKRKRESEWASQIEDTGAEIWDGVIGGVYFHIPREYVWIGSRKRDGVDYGRNFLFHAPGITSSPEPDSPYKDRTDIEGIIRYFPPPKTYPCQGFEGRKLCKNLGFRMSFYGYVHCDNQKAPKRYLARWRRECVIGENKSRYTEILPTFDRELNAWNINDEAFYRGPAEFPTYYIVCPKIPKSEDKTIEDSRERCESGFQLTDQVFVIYSFPQRMFWEHEEIQEKIRQKIISFIDAAQREEVKEQAYGYLQ